MVMEARSVPLLKMVDAVTRSREWCVTCLLDSKMASDVERAYCGWPHHKLEDEEDSQEESISGILDHGSISFGRYEGESLSWEKWSVFSHNRCQEELEKFKAPGLVAQKKAYFEEYYNKIRALKNLQRDQQDEQETVSLDSPDADNHPSGTTNFANGEVEYHQEIIVHNRESPRNPSTFIHEEPERLSKQMFDNRDECLTNGEVVDEIYKVVEIHLVDQDLEDSRSCIIDEMVTGDSQLSDNVEDSLMDEEKNLLTIVEPSVKVIAQSEAPQAKKVASTCETAKGGEDHKKLKNIDLNMKRYKDPKKIELNVKQYKEKISLVKTSVSSGVIGKGASLHKCAAKSLGHQKLDNKSKLPPRLPVQTIQRDKCTDLMNRRITVTSRPSMSASSRSLPTITWHPSSVASKQLGASATKAKSSSCMDSIVKQKNAKITSDRKMTVTSNTQKTSRIILSERNIHKPAADTKRTLEEISRKSRPASSNSNVVKKASTVLSRTRTISANDVGKLSHNMRDRKLRSETIATKMKDLKGNSQLKETQNKMQEKEKSNSTASKSTGSFTALPLPRFYWNAPTQMQKQVPSKTRAAKAPRCGEKPRQPVWR